MTVFLELVRHSVLSVFMYLAARIANVVMFVIVGRIAGPDQAGTLSLAFTYLLMFSVFTRGLDELVTRQSARHPEATRHYLGTFLILRAGLSFVLYLVMLGVVYLAIDYSDYTRQSIALMGLSMIPDSLGAVGQAVLIGRRSFGPPTIIALLMSAARVVGGGLVLLMGGGVLHLGVVWTLGGLLSMVLLFAATWRTVGPLSRHDWIDLPFMTRTLRPALPFLIISFLLAFEFQIDVILLSVFHGEAEVGWYSAATTITATITMLSQAYKMAVYPLMARYEAQAPEKLELLYNRSMRYLGVGILPMVGGIALLSPQIVGLIFGNGFSPTIQILRIVVWSLILIFLDVPNTRMMYVRDRQNYTSLFLLGSMATNISLNLILDGPLGAEGAAIARVCSSAVFFAATYIYVKRFLLPCSIVRLVYKPALATVGMIAILWLIRSWHLWAMILVGAAGYGGLLVALGGIPSADLALIHQAICTLRQPQDHTGCGRGNST